MTREETSSEEPARTESFAVQGALRLDLSLNTGAVTVHLDEPAADPPSYEATVEIRHVPSLTAPWADGVSAVLTWVGEHFGEQFGTATRPSPADAVAETRVEHLDGRLVVTGPRELPARNVPLAVTVRAPAGSDVHSSNGTAGVTITGAAGSVDVSTGSGNVLLDSVATASRVRSGSGSVTVRRALGGLDVKTSSGASEISEVAASANIAAGSGSIWIGQTTAELAARTGSGGIVVAEAGSGSIELSTGSGDVRTAIAPGTLAYVDVSSGSGRVVSEPDVATEPPEKQPDLTVHARTGTGNAFITSTAR